MTSADSGDDRMPSTLRVAVTILSVVTVLVGILSLVLAPFIWAWGGGWLCVLPFAPLIAFATVTILVMNRKSWARFATPLFPITFAIAAAAVTPFYEFLILLVVVALTTAAVVLIFVPSSRVYFAQRQITSPAN